MQPSDGEPTDGRSSRRGGVGGSDFQLTHLMGRLKPGDESGLCSLMSLFEKLMMSAAEAPNNPNTCETRPRWRRGGWEGQTPTMLFQSQNTCNYFSCICMLASFLPDLLLSSRSYHPRLKTRSSLYSPHLSASSSATSSLPPPALIGSQGEQWKSH